MKAFFNLGSSIAPAEGDVFGRSEAGWRDESRFEEPIVLEDHPGVQLVGN